MNKTELLGWEWLKKQGYKKKDVKFNCNKSPDFICSDGKRYEIKIIVGKSISFFPIQIKSLKKEDIILVFDKEKFITKFFWKERRKRFPFNILLKKEITIQIPKEILDKLKSFKIAPRETYTEVIKRIFQENKELKETFKNFDVV